MSAQTPTLQQQQPSRQESKMGERSATIDREAPSSQVLDPRLRNAALYERLGFQLIRELRVGGNPPLRLMLRPSTHSEVKR